MKRTKKLLSFFLAIVMVITAIPAFSITASAAEIDEAAYSSAISSYLSKMNDSYVYYNMQAAYNAYIALKQSYDLCKYGGSTTVTADTVNTNITKLNTAVNNMTQWTQYNSFFVPTTGAQMFAGDNSSGIVGTNYKDYYANLLYASGPQDDVSSQSESSMQVFWNMPYAVALYNGNEIRIPVMCGMINTATGIGTNARYLFTSWLGDTTGGIDYGNNWMYRETTGTKHFSWVVDSPTYSVSKLQSNANNYYVTVPKGSNTRFLANYFSIKPDSFSNNYKEFTSLNLQARGSNSTGHSNNSGAGAGLKNTAASVGFYIIDYRPVINNLTTAKTKIKSGIANFDSDNSDMAELMDSVDKLTSVNNTIETTFPLTASGVSKTDCQTKAKSVASTITSNVSEFTTNNGKTAADSSKTTAYNDLRTAMDNAMANYNLGAEELKKTYTATSVNNFITAYNNAKSIMSKVGPFDDNYGHDASDTNDKAVALEQAWLVAKANFNAYNNALDTAVNGDGYLKGYTSNSEAVLPTYTALQKYEDITIYTNKDDTPSTKQTEIDATTTTLGNANSNICNRVNQIDQSTLKAFVSHIATFDKDVYDETAVNTVKSNIDDIYKTVSFNGVDYYSLDVKDLDDYDSKLRGFINSFNSALDEYTVTVPSNVTAKVNGSPVTPTTTSPSKTYTLPYGTNVTFTTDDNALTAWYMDYTSNVTSRGKQFQKHAESFTTKIIGSIKIYAESASDSASCVTIVRQYNQANVSPALDRVSYVTTGNAYTLPTEPTRVANYNFIGYYVKGTKITDASVTISADTQIVAMYQYVGAEIDVTTYAFDGTSATTKYAYNANVTIDEPSAYAWVEQVGTSDTWRPFYIGTTCTFKVSEPTVLKPVTETEFKEMFTDEAYAPILRQNGATADEAGRAVINAQRIDYLPSGAEIQEFGILVSKNAASDFDLVNNENTIRCKSSQGLDKVQFTIFLKGAGSRPFTYRSYMIYKLADGTIKTVYSDVANYPVTNA